MSASAATTVAKRPFARTESSVLGPKEKKTKVAPDSEEELMEIDLSKDVGKWEVLEMDDRMRGHAVYNWSKRQTL